MDKDSREVKPLKNVLALIYNQLPSLFEQKQKGVFYTIFDYLAYCNRYVVIPIYDEHGQVLAFKILHALIGRVDEIVEMGLMRIFNLTLSRYITRNNRNYNVDSHYRKLIDHMLRTIEKFSKNRALMIDLINHGLRLGMITP
jgi:hypothetical protein